jgi:hypothetical protein
MKRGNPFTILKRAFRNLYFLMFLNGFLIASLFYFRMQSSYEDGLFASIKSSIDHQIDTDDTRDSIVVKAMSVCHQLMHNRASTFAGANMLGPEADFFNAASVDLMTTRGACGSYALVLARLLNEYGYPVRIAQMKAQGIFGAHNLVEVNTGNSWVVLDPTFDLHFVRPDAHLASFADVQHNWNYYSAQTPKDYNPVYRYEDVRYTNWSKIPVLFPTIKSIFRLTIGPDRTNTFSIRTLFLKIYTVYFYIILFLCIPVMLTTIRRLIKIKVFPNPDIPFTFNNLVKYMRAERGNSSYIH